ncbi:SpoIIE family protein phosphatase [Phytomonospora sp. NPDC050363]|uniref:PP2C family protein-serine/threonine phosphatase n=1 Tax=Phytomonospora sp. NPDC050363 TaxID=3155642 RepID=UPI0033E538C5
MTADRRNGDDPAFAALLEDSAEDLYENAPCGYLSTLLDGRIAKINTTLLDWLGMSREELVGRKYFSDLLTVGGKLYHETHFGPLLRMQGEINGIALELKTADGSRLPVLVTSVLKAGGDGRPLLVRTTIFDARDRRAYEVELLRARQIAERERERLQRLTATLQKTLLPPKLPDVPGLDVAAGYHVASADEVGGDFYDLFPLGPGRWGMFLGDVCGKGAGAAVVTSSARYTLRAAAVYEPEAAAVLADLNSLLARQYSGPESRYLTLLFGVLTALDDGSFDVTLASGGHPSALLLRHDGTADYVPTPGGQLIGILPNAHITTTKLRLLPGDTLLLYTDGITDAHTDGDRRYGPEALLAFARQLAPASPQATVAALSEIVEGFGEGADDDVALLSVGVPRKA